MINEHYCTKCGGVCDCNRDMSECDWCLTCEEIAEEDRRIKSALQTMLSIGAVNTFTKGYSKNDPAT